LLEVQPELKSLLSGIAGAAKIFARDEKLPSFDFHCPLLSLPPALGTELNTIPADVPYLRLPIDRLEQWKSRFPRERVLRIGHCCSGSPGNKNDHNRSIALSRLEPLFSRPCTEFIYLQKDLRAIDAEFLRGRAQMAVHLGNELADFVDMAA